MTAVSHVDLDDFDPASEDDEPPAPTGAEGAGDVPMGAMGTLGDEGSSELRVELAVPQEADDIPAPLLVEADAQLDGIADNPLEMDYDDEVLQIGKGLLVPFLSGGLTLP